MKRISILFLTLLAFVVVACGTEQSSPEASPTATPEPTATPTATPDPTAAATDDDDEDGTGSGAPNELAAILPSEVDGISIEYEYTTGPDLGDESEMDDEGREFLERIGGDVNRMSSAFGFGIDQAAGSFITILAFRIPGADEQAMLDEFRAALADDESDVEFSEATVGGKDVLAASSAEQGTSYLYADDDTLIVVGATTTELADAALAEIP